MADARINALTEDTALADSDWLVAEVGDSEARKVSVETLRTAIGGTPLLFASTVSPAGTTIDTGANGIPATCTDLLILGYLRTTEATAFSTASMTLNNDTSAVYDRATIRTDNVTLAGSNTLAANNWPIRVAGASIDSNFFSAVRITIPNYTAATGFNKSAEGQAMVLSTDATECSVIQYGFLWRSGSAITRITFVAGSASNFVAGSRIAIYGLGSA